MDKEQLITLVFLGLVVFFLWQVSKVPTKWMKIGVRGLTFVSIFSAFCDLYLEEADILTFFIWCIFPVASMFVYVKSEARGWVRGSFVYSCVVTWFYVQYALSGLMDHRSQGAGHMHVAVFPILLAVCTLLLLLYALLVRTLQRRRKANEKPDSHGATENAEKKGGKL